jgi:hypothetical protein
LSSVFERLRLPEIAAAVCEKALPEDGTPSLVEHHLIWLKAGYLGQLDTAPEKLDRLTRVFGPRANLRDTEAVMLMLRGQPQAAVKMTRELTLHDPLNDVLMLHHRLAGAFLLPKGPTHEEP